MSKRGIIEFVVAVVLLAIIGGQGILLWADSILLTQWEQEYFTLRETTNMLLQDYLECQEKGVKSLPKINN